METPEDIKSRIIEEAQKHFRQYGFNKTTMAEIAKDCHMSAANLYRYFENKEEIGVEIANGCLFNGETCLRDIVRQTGMTAAQKLEALVLRNIQYSFEFFADQPRLSELVEFIMQERKDIVTRHKESLRSLLAEILAEGNRNGEFNVPDILETAQIIQFATMGFNAPPMVMLGFYSLEEIERQAKGVIKLLVQGLS